MIRIPLMAVASALALSLALPAAAQQGGPPIRTAVDGTFAPHAMPKLGGGVEGFQIDLFTEVAKRMKREIVIDSASFSGLIPAMNAGRYDFLAAPVTVTKERTESLLFTEGYLFTEYQLLIRKGSPQVKGLDELKGKVISVNKGSAYDSWARANAEKYGSSRNSATPGGTVTCSVVCKARNTSLPCCIAFMQCDMAGVTNVSASCCSVTRCGNTPVTAPLGAVTSVSGIGARPILNCSTTAASAGLVICTKVGAID